MVLPTPPDIHFITTRGTFINPNAQAKTLFGFLYVIPFCTQLVYNTSNLLPGRRTEIVRKEAAAKWMEALP